jgi:hypothetical protein
MSARIVHRLTGYDRQTDILAVENDVPAEDLARVKEIARVGCDDPDAIGSYPLDKDQAERIGRLLGAKVDFGKYDFFLEPFAEQE